MRLTPGFVFVALALLLSQPCLAKKAPIEPSPALKHSEALMADAEKLGAPNLVPNLWLAALEKLNTAYDMFHKQVEAGARDADDREAIIALRAAEKAEVDAELALVSAQASRDEAMARSPRGRGAGGYRQAPLGNQSSVREGQP